MIESLLILLLSLLALGKAAQTAIDNAIKVAKYLHISEIAVGFIILSVSTSLPELFVSVIASLESEPGISLGTLLGANIADMGIVSGTALLLATITLPKKESGKLKKTLLVAAFVPVLILLDPGIYTAIILLSIFALYSYFILKERIDIDGIAPIGRREAMGSGILFIFGILLIMASSKYVVESAVDIAEMFGLSRVFIAATTIALGTTLPELVVSVAAIRRRRLTLALGNAAGSCITNLTLVLGISALISPLKANLLALSNVVVFHTIIIALMLLFLRYKSRLGRAEGIALLVTYLLFIIIAAFLETLK
ncbi:MAG: sodium:calcium antiporter [Candidatus Altiarchaeota archaeon]|nr:sodium:calcium antiporter [Candidatus Altiarchaeota archaeon]